MFNDYNPVPDCNIHGLRLTLTYPKDVCISLKILQHSGVTAYLHINIACTILLQNFSI